MFHMANSILKNEQDAEDIVHDVFCKIASSHMDTITNAKKEEDIRNYLLKSVKHASISATRKRKVRSDYEEKQKKDKSELSDNEFLDKLCNSLDSEKLMKAMDSLDEKYREVLYYHLVVGLSTFEMAKMLDRKQSTVQKQIARGKNLLVVLFPNER